MKIPLAAFEKTQINIRDAASTLDLPGYSDSGTPADNFGNLIARVMNIVMAAALLLVLFYLVTGAVDWISSAGEKSKTEAARNKMTNAIIGIIVLSATLAIFKFVQYLLGVEIITFM